MSRIVVVVGALDTKGQELKFVRDLIRQEGLKTLVVDFGVLGEAFFPPDFDRREVADAGGGDLEYLRSGVHKDEAMKVMAAGLEKIVRSLYDEGRLDGIIAMGGTAGTSLATTAMRALPVGVPKVMVSTVGGGDVSSYGGKKDIAFIHSIVDVAGFNRISRMIYVNAAGAIAGMVKMGPTIAAQDKPLVTASMYGNTTPCVNRARITLESKGFEVLVFHATGQGGRSMEDLISDGHIMACLDITTTELADEVCGGIFSAGPDRTTAAARAGIPTLLVPGCVDMCNFSSRKSIPTRYKNRNFYEWNPNVVLMRTNPEENATIGKMLASSANESKGPVAFLLPLRGLSMLGGPGGPFWDPEADQACFNAIRENLKPGILCQEMDLNINDPKFADQAAATLLELIHSASATDG